MIPRRTSFPHSILIASFICATTLTSCGDGGFIDKITGEDGRSEQMVGGPRRLPRLNPASAPRAEQPASSSERVLPPQVQKAAAASPFDQYDDQGNFVGTPPAAQPQAAAVRAPEPKAPATQESSSAFDRWFGSWDNVDTTSTAPQPLASVRKPFLDNSYTGETVATAPIPQVTPPSKPSPIVSEPAKAGEPVPLMLAPEANNGSVSAPTISREVSSSDVTVSQAPKEERGFFDRARDSFKSIAGEEEVSRDSVEEDYPALSSVPAKPQQFDNAKASKEDTMNELEAAHSIAQEEKQMLSAEPSQQQGTVIAETPKPLVSASSSVKGNEPQLLGQMSDKKVAADPAPISESVKEVVVAPAPVQMEEPAPVATSEKKSWWDRWSLPQEDSQSAAREEETVETVEPVTPVMSGEAKHLEAAEEVTTVPAPLLAPAARSTPVTQQVVSETKDENSASTAQTTSDGLPSTQVLKTLPPSRYNVRARDRQFYLVP